MVKVWTDGKEGEITPSGRTKHQSDCRSVEYLGFRYRCACTTMVTVAIQILACHWMVNLCASEIRIHPPNMMPPSWNRTALYNVPAHALADHWSRRRQLRILQIPCVQNNRIAVPLCSIARTNFPPVCSGLNPWADHGSYPCACVCACARVYVCMHVCVRVCVGGGVDEWMQLANRLSPSD